MKLLSMMKFQLKNVLPWTLAFYLVMVGNLYFFNSRFAPTQVIGIVVGSTAVFTFFLGLFSFRKNFSMALAEGVSRRTMFAGAVILLVALSVITTYFSIALGAFLMQHGPSSAYPMPSNIVSSLAQGVFISLPWQTCLCVLTALGGYFIAILFFRVTGNHTAQGNSRIPFIALLALSLIFGQLLFSAGALLLSLTFGILDSLAPNLYIFYLAFAVLSLFLILGSYLLIRRVTIDTPDPLGQADNATNSEVTPESIS